MTDLERGNYHLGALAFLLMLAVLGGLMYTMVDLTDSDTVTVDLESDNEMVASVEAVVVEEEGEMEVGLSGYEDLSDGDGMLFVHDEPGEYTYGMPEMAFGIDIVFISSECEVTELHSADQPRPDESGLEPEHQYSGEGAYVLEVPQGYATDRISEGDLVSIRGGMTESYC